MNVSQVSSRAFVSDAYSHNATTGTKNYSAATARNGADSVSFSGEALRLATQTNQTAQSDNTAKAEETLVRPNFLLAMKDDKELDIVTIFNKLAEADPEKFKEMLGTLATGDPEEFVQALANMTGENADDLREALSNMSAEDVGRFAKQLNDLGVPPSSAFFHGMSLVTSMDIDELMESYHSC